MKRIVSILFAAMMTFGMCSLDGQAKSDETSIVLQRRPNKEWAEENGWSVHFDSYKKTVNQVNYELYYGENQYDMWCNRGPYWHICVEESVKAAGVVEIEDFIDGFPVTDIAPNAFSWDSALKEVVIPEGIEYIGVGAFHFCYNMEKVTLPDSIKVIDAGAFYFCESLPELTIPAAVERVGTSLAYGDSKGQGVKNLTFQGDAPELMYTTEFRKTLENMEYTQIHIYDDAIGWDSENWEGLNLVRHEREADAKECIDKSALRTSIIEAYLLDPTDYAEGTMEKVDKELTAAEKILVSNEVTMAQVNEAKAQLDACLGSLEKKPTAAETFDDLQDQAWYMEAVEYVYKNELMSGYEGSFMPDATMTRAMIVQTLYNWEGRPEVTDRTACELFSDVALEDWYADAVCWAYQNGITTGDTYAMKFRGNAPVTREELAAFFFRYAKMLKIDTSLRADMSHLRNVEQVSPYAADAVSWSVKTQIIKGVQCTDAQGNGYYDLAPKSSATRSQMATILMRFDKIGIY